MESLELAEEGALSLPNTFRKLRTSYLRYCLLSGCLCVILLSCSSVFDPGCIDRTPRQTTTGLECHYQWKWGKHLCDSYCCNGTTLGVKEGDWCVDYCFEDGTCQMERCAPAQSQAEYVALQMLRWSGAVAFYVVWMLFFLMGRMVCRTTTALEKKTACRTGCLFAVFTVFLYGLYSIYLFTDCHHEFRGISDLFLAAGLLASFLCVRYLVGVASSHSGVESYDMLLAMISDSYTRGDGRTLVLEVGQERLRDFWQENLSGQTDTAFTVSKRYRYCIAIVLISLCCGICGILFTPRQRFFLCWMGFFGSVLPMMYFYALTLAPVQNWTMRRKAAKALANLPSRDKVVLFANSRSPENAAERQSAEYMSIAYFSGHDPVLFRTETDETLVWSRTVRTAITETNGHWYLSFTTTARRSTASLLQSSDVQVEVPRHFPLEASDVRLAREWLQQHEIFGLQ